MSNGDRYAFSLVVFTFLGFVFMFGATYLLALAGEPQSLWLMELLGFNFR